MGRHSAPDDERDVAAPVSAPAAPPRPGRHARGDEAAAEAAATDAEAAKPSPKPRVAPDVGTEPEPAGKRIGKGNHETSADLALLRERPDVRNRCIAALVVPFVLYTAVLLLIGAVHVYLIWIWIPLVTAGVVAGSILDSAHRRSSG